MPGWSLFVDVEGFSEIYSQDQKRALILMRELADVIHAIGNRAFPDESERLFAYGLGDGFLIVPGIEAARPEKPVAIAIALMHHMLGLGGLLKASISRGEVADVTGCFSQRVLNGSMGDGIIMIFPIMGNALANAYKLGAGAKGASVLLDASMVSDLPKEVRYSRTDPVRIDWLHSRWPLLNRLIQRAGLHLFSAVDAKQRLLAYIEIENKHLNQKWIEMTLEFVDSSTNAGAL